MRIFFFLRDKNPPRSTPTLALCGCVSEIYSKGNSSTLLLPRILDVPSFLCNFFLFPRRIQLPRGRITRRNSTHIVSVAFHSALSLKNLEKKHPQRIHFSSSSIPCFFLVPRSCGKFTSHAFFRTRFCIHPVHLHISLHVLRKKGAFQVDG